MNQLEQYQQDILDGNHDSLPLKVRTPLPEFKLREEKKGLTLGLKDSNKHIMEFLSRSNEIQIGEDKGRLQ